MLRGLYTAAAGMIAAGVNNDVIANNVANSNTTGFKRDAAINREFGDMLAMRIDDGPDRPYIGYLGRGSQVDEIYTQHTQGAIVTTGNALDVAIDGRGYLAVETPAGVRYTRDGALSRNADGELVTLEGYRVQGANGGAIRADGANVTIGADGRVTVDGVETGQLRFVQFADERALQKEGANLYRAPAGAPAQPAAGRINQGCLEKSNVNVVWEMVNMIHGYRVYESNAKAVQTQDQLLDKAVNDVGRV